MSRILVTGGAGFIGSAVINHLQKTGHDIFVIDNLSFGNRNFVKIEDNRFFVDDILNKQRMLEIFNQVQPEYVVHLAAIHFIPYCNAHPFESANINIQGTMNVLEAAKAIGAKQFFMASTAAVYPVYDGPLNENHATGPMDIYGLSKLACEKICHEFFLDTNITTVVCRFFNAFGPNETNPHLIPEIERQVKEGLKVIKLGNLTPRRDFIHTHDMAEAVQTLLEKINNGYHIYNLGRGIEYSVTEIVEAFERVSGNKIKIEVDEARVRKVERQHLLADVSKLMLLGWQPKWSIDQGIATMLKNNSQMA